MEPTARIADSISDNFVQVVLPLYDPIPGWLGWDEAFSLFALAAMLPSPAPVIVEIGSFLGKSTACLAAGIADKLAGRVFAIDPFEDTYIEKYVDEATKLGVPNLLDQFRKNMEPFGHKVEPVRGFSNQFHKLWWRPIDLLFIDGDHSSAAVRADITNWGTHLKHDGIMALHDVYMPDEVNNQGYEPGPYKALEELVFGKPEWVGSVRVNSLFTTRRK